MNRINNFITLVFFILMIILGFISILSEEYNLLAISFINMFIILYFAAKKH